MLRTDKLARKADARAVTCVALLAVSILVGGCATPVAEAPAPVAAEPEIPVLPPIEPAKRPTVPLIPPPVETPPEPVAVIVSSSQPAYEEVAAALTYEFEDARVYNLEKNVNSPATIMRQVNDSDTGAVIAVGLRAARSAVAISSVPVVFSQVFNTADPALESDNARGVAAYAPLDKQLAEWRAVDPDISRVGLIIGEGHDDLVAEAERAALAQDIELLVHVSSSDQETLYVFRRMSREIDGYWLFPDSRILSARSLREMTQIARAQRVRLAVQNPSLLSLGASVSLATVAEDIAGVIAGIVTQIREGHFDEVPRLTALRQVEVTTVAPAVAGVQ